MVRYDTIKTSPLPIDIFSRVMFFAKQENCVLVARNQTTDFD